MDFGPRAPHRLPTPDAPRELCKAVLPPYTVEPPDILLIDAIHVAPKSPYHLKTGDLLSLNASGTLEESPIDGAYPVMAGGKISLGHQYGQVAVGGMTIDEARQAIDDHLKQWLNAPQVSLLLADFRAKQQIAGEHLVGPDGTVTLGAYGSVQIVGMTLAEAKAAIEAHLEAYLDEPEVSVDVFAYNSKVFYVITQGAGLGDRVYRFPITGNETVLDAVSQINGLEQVSSKRMWIARAGRNSQGSHQILPIQWDTITQCGDAQTNYQLFPGDRLYIAEDKWIAIDTAIAKVLSPLERIMGFSILGAETATRFYGPVLRGGGNPRGRGY